MPAATLDEHATREILALLQSIPDPEIPAISVADLGIIRGVRADPPAVMVTPTYTGCPATLVIETSIRLALDDAGYRHVTVETILSPPWTTDWITDAGRENLRAYGIAPPPMGAGSPSLKRNEPAECPRCGSLKTREISRFGSTPCKALWQCLECSEPFDRFKCH